MKKILAFLMALCMLVTLMPFALAEDLSIYPEITSEEELRAAGQNGGTYVVNAGIYIYGGAITVHQDLVLYMNDSISMYNWEDPTTKNALFIVEGASLTLDWGNNGTQAGCFYQGCGSIVELIASPTQTTALISKGCNWNTYLFDSSSIPTSLFNVTAPAGTIIPQITLDQGSYYSFDAFGGDQGAIFSGDPAEISVYGGTYRMDMSEYLGEDLICLRQYGEYKVFREDSSFSSDFTLIDENGVMTVNRYAPQTEMDIMNFADYLFTVYGYPQGMQEYEFFSESYDTEAQTMYVGKTNEMSQVVELHKVKFNFVYDEAIKAQVDALVEKFPEGVYNEEYGYAEPYFFQVSDLELFNYWMTCNESNDWFNVNNLINYSSEFKKLIDYRNFRLDARAGDGDFFYTMAYGIADFCYDGTVYASTEIGVNADHILYVSGGLTSEDEMMAAAQTRLDRYFGAGKVLVEKLTDEEKTECGMTDPVDCSVFKTTINDYTYYFKAVPDSTKWLIPSYRNVDVRSEVEVLSDATAEFPLDAMLDVDRLTEGEEYERITKIMNFAEHETFDINLFSSSINEFVTKLVNGSFEVQIPISSQLEGKELAVYYVDANGKAEEYEVTVKDGKASFITDHFSVYTLATPVELPESGLPGLDVPEYGDTEKHDYVWSDETKSYLCECGEKYKLTLDLDGDGTATTADTIQLLRTIDKMGDLPGFKADINQDGKVSVYDAVRHLQLLNE